MKTTATLIALLFVACSNLPLKSQRDSKLIGFWMCESATVDGKALPPETIKLLRLRVTETRYTTDKGAETLFDSTYRVDRSTTPAQIFMLGNEGDLTGKEAHGIYEASADRLHICYTMPGDPPPTSFSSIPGSKATLVMWCRASAP